MAADDSERARSLPNIVSVFFGGMLSDKIGTDVCITVCIGANALSRSARSTAVITHYAGLFLLGNAVPLADTFNALLAGRLLVSVARALRNCVC